MGSKPFVRMLGRWAAITVLTLGYGVAILISRLTPRAKHRGRIEDQKALVIGTFHNPNWFHAHIVPLARSGLGELLVVADGYTDPIPGIRLLTPPAWVSRVLTRAGAKLLWAGWYSLRYRPQLYIGYAIFPAAALALVLGRLLRGRTCFQLTSGPLELAGGGYRAENRLLSSLGAPSPWMEKLAHALTRRFDLMVVRGQRAREYVRSLGFDRQIEIITGSLDIPSDSEVEVERDIDLVFVGRLTERKRPLRFVELASLVEAQIPQVRAAIIGDGPERKAVERRIEALRLERNVSSLGLRKDVGALLAKSRVFVLTSRWEGLSIAMMEAMAAGAVPVVNDVGDLADMVDNGRNGHLVEDNDIQSAARLIVSLLGDERRLSAMSQAARSTAIERCGREAIASRWHDALTRLFS